MGLNLETLIGILVILILLILADGVRRMIRERHGRLRMRIDRRFGKDHGKHQEPDDEDDYPTDLGKPRVRRRDEQPSDLDQPGGFDMGRVDDDEAVDPPMMMDPDDGVDARPDPARISAARRAEQQSLFGADEADHDDTPAPRAREPLTPPPREESLPEPEHHQRPPEPAPRRPEPPRAADVTESAEAGRRSGFSRETPEDAPESPRAKKPRAPAQESAPLEVIVFHLIARRPDRFDGQAMLRLLLESGLRYGDMHIFHRHRETAGQERLEFSVANAVEPGTFDIDTMEEEQFAGITFFMKLPGPGEPLGALDRMLSVGRRMAEELEGDLKDEQHSVLTPQTMEHLRQRVQEFERRQRVSHGA